MSEEKIPGESKLDRRRFLSTAAMTVAAAQSGVFDSARAQAGATLSSGGAAGKRDATTSFAPLQQIDAPSWPSGS